MIQKKNEKYPNKFKIVLKINVGEPINAVFVGEENGRLLFGLKYLLEKPYDENLYDLSIEDLLKYCGHGGTDFIGECRVRGAQYPDGGRGRDVIVLGHFEVEEWKSGRGEERGSGEGEGVGEVGGEGADDGGAAA